MNKHKIHFTPNTFISKLNIQVLAVEPWKPEGLASITVRCSCGNEYSLIEKSLLRKIRNGVRTCLKCKHPTIREGKTQVKLNKPTPPSVPYVSWPARRII
jgi:hypothetical protein